MSFNDANRRQAAVAYKHTVENESYDSWSGFLLDIVDTHDEGFDNEETTIFDDMDKAPPVFAPAPASALTLKPTPPHAHPHPLCKPHVYATTGLGQG